MILFGSSIHNLTIRNILSENANLMNDSSTGLLGDVRIAKNLNQVKVEYFKNKKIKTILLGITHNRFFLIFRG
jgi:hypothetical protein